MNTMLFTRAARADNGRTPVKCFGRVEVYESGDVLPDGDLHVGEDPVFVVTTRQDLARSSCRRYWVVRCDNAADGRARITAYEAACHDHGWAHGSDAATDAAVAHGIVETGAKAG